MIGSKDEDEGGDKETDGNGDDGESDSPGDMSGHGFVEGVVERDHDGVLNKD